MKKIRAVLTAAFLVMNCLWKTLHGWTPYGIVTREVRKRDSRLFMR